MPSARIVVEMGKFQIRGMTALALAALSWGCSAEATGAESDQVVGTGEAGRAANSGGAAGVTKQSAGAGGTGAIGGTSGAPSGGAAAVSFAGHAGSPEAGAGGSVTTAGAGGSASGDGAGGSAVSAAGAPAGGGAGANGVTAGGAGGTPPQTDPHPGCDPGFDYYELTGGCMKVIGRFVGGDMGAIGCSYQYAEKDVATCATFTWTKEVGDASIQLMAQPGYSYTLTRFDGACPVPCYAH